ncbi:MAG: hypothetical protein AAF844_22295 [Pseudomonadota bacterium]
MAVVPRPDARYLLAMGGISDFRLFRAALPLALSFGLAACAPDEPGVGSDTTGAAASAPAGSAGGLEEGLSTLPTGLWSVRLTGRAAEAVVSNGSANIGFSCANNTLGVRFRPSAGPDDATLRLTARGRQTASIELDFETAGRDMVWTGNTRGPESAFLRALENGAALSVTGRPGIDAAFPGTGAREAISNAVASQGCIAG